MATKAGWREVSQVGGKAAERFRNVREMEVEERIHVDGEEKAKGAGTRAGRHMWPDLPCEKRLER